MTASGVSTPGDHLEFSLRYAGTTVAVSGFMTRLLAVAVVAAACTEPRTSSTAGESFEAFKSKTYKEPWSGGVYIVDGDRPITSELALRRFCEGLQQGALAVDTIGVGGPDDVWDDTTKLDLTYCVDDGFGGNKPAVLDALAQATTGVGWETMANVHFDYVASEDGNCNIANVNVLFDIRPVFGQPYLARSFFPSFPRVYSELLIDSSSFNPSLTWPLAHIVGHELGHVLGFRHEHTRPEAGVCFEDNEWRALTPYDSASIMHYPQCHGTSTDLNWTDLDAQGAAALYGPPPT
jgi:hypothetical protein